MHNLQPHPASGPFLRWEPDPLNEILGTGYDRYTSITGICGVGKIEGNTFNILACHTYTPGQGQFRSFITMCKNWFNTLRVEAIMEPELPAILIRYGFTPAENNSYQWVKPT